MYEMFSSVDLTYLSPLGLAIGLGEPASQEMLKLNQSVFGLWCDCDMENSSVQRCLCEAWAVQLLQRSSELEKDACRMCPSEKTQSFGSENLSV